MSQPSGTNCPRDFLRRGPFSHPGSSNTVRYLSQELYDIRFKNLRDLGGYSNGVPPLPIPNREVKPINADGTAVTCGRVGSRHFKERFARVAPFFLLCSGVTFFRLVLLPRRNPRDNGSKDALGIFTEKQCTPSLFYLSAFKENAYGVSLHLFCACAVRLTSAICRLYHNGKLSSSRGLLLHVSVDFVPMLCLCVVLSAWLFSLPASWLYCVVRWPVGSVWAVVPN